MNLIEDEKEDEDDSTDGSWSAADFRIMNWDLNRNGEESDL
jgi:hypothetical protein